ncbi:MAG: deferrochelatase/peroxidase EfeB [Gaiellales bacterium]|jgi:deferrochelatase/peroxidase EfeB|nr:deferrochelatase/peroxidase EfeB [Gaiellales bacterium]
MGKDAQQPDGQRLSRRALIGLAGAAGGGVLLGGGGYVALRDGGETVAEASPAIEPFYGAHQGGIVTPQQKYLHFAAFDVTAMGRSGLVELMQRWTQTAEGLTAGTTRGIEDPRRLTVTFGFGTSLFDSRFGLASSRPEALVDIPPFKHDKLDAGVSDGDICVQVCSEDKVVALHAAGALEAATRGSARMKWAQEGFVRDTLPGEKTPRNLFGFKDGSNNLKVADAAKMQSNVWVSDVDGPSWMAGGTYLVSRRILMQIEEFLPESPPLQEDTFGRSKATGAPLGEVGEFTAVDPAKVLADSHIMMANPRKPGSEAERILRRGYNYTNGYDPQLSSPTGGLFFLAFQRDPRRQFIPIQQRLDHGDRLTKYVVHQSSGMFAVPPGVAAGGFVGESLLR